MGFEKYFNQNLNEDCERIANDIITMDDGRLLICGSAKCGSRGGDDCYIMILGCDYNFQHASYIDLSSINTSLNDNLISISKSTGSIDVLGYTENKEVFIISLTPSGEFITHQTLSNTSDILPTGLTQSNAHYYVSGIIGPELEYRRPYLQKVNKFDFSHSSLLINFLILKDHYNNAIFYDNDWIYSSYNDVGTSNITRHDPINQGLPLFTKLIKNNTGNNLKGTIKDIFVTKDGVTYYCGNDLTENEAIFWVLFFYFFFCQKL